ncbi:hypothetical protein [Streptomyces sp. SP18CS02]|uniref:hypothetical protein n=1 Tax=Streptomyces sp. SP18CS02 TaxID=3002531 RepID=UPI002E780DA6|nr:hypothetical protein [Streptomyces sp. SP18CS02]MEE1751137.1 hypothetical protein [Streptomyces sp. SP18CS02]
MAGLAIAALADLDRDFYAARRHPDVVRAIGIDVSQPALDYAVAVALLNEGHCLDLEHTEPTERLRCSLDGTVLITITGGTSFLTARTLTRLFTAIGRPVPVAAFVWVTALAPAPTRRGGGS